MSKLAVVAVAARTRGMLVMRGMLHRARLRERNFHADAAAEHDPLR